LKVNLNNREIASSPVFYILCGNAAYNRGDRGNLYSQLALLHRFFPAATLVLDSSRPEVDQLWFKALVLKRSLIPNRAQRHWLRQADIVICGGGALLADNSCRLLVPYWLVYLAYVKWILRKPLMLWAHGLVLETPIGRFLGRHALNLADCITVRDSGSLRTCQDLWVRPPCQQTADPAILISPGTRADGEAVLRAERIPLDRPLICLSPTFWHLYHDQRSWLPYPMGKRFARTLKRNRDLLQQYLQGLARLASLLAERHRARIVLLPRYASPEWNDITFCQQIAAAAALPGRIHVFVKDSYTPNQLYAVWRCFMFNVSVSLHDAIFATAMDCPVLHLSYESKGTDFFEALHAPQQVMPWQTILDPQGVNKIADRVEEVLAHWPQMKEQRSEAVQALQERAAHNGAILKSLYDQVRAP
jgi:polysaccharide pyruvyl transferase WcaK-like protein